MKKKSPNGFYEIPQNEMMEIDGGVIPVALGVAYVAIFGVGFTAGVTMGIKKWF